MKNKVTITFILGAMFLLHSINSKSQVSFEFDPMQLGKTITNKATLLNYWDLSSWQSPLSYNFFSTNFPYVKKVQIMMALGGNAQRDQFNNPQDNNNLYDYNFTKLIKACENIVNQNLTPQISLCWVPLKYSNNPSIGIFGTNVRPPKDYVLWYKYVRAAVNALVNKFGISKVRTWWWCVGNEFENSDMFYDGISAQSTKQEFFKFYDYTVAALESVLGAQYVNVGVHSMTCSPGLWDEREFIDHCKIGTNYYTNSIGTQLDFYQISYYDPYPNGFDKNNFLYYVNFIKQHLNYRGYGNIPFGISEGRVLYGWDNKDLGPREVLHPIQGSMDAKRIITMIENDIDWFSTWGCYASIYNNKPVNLVSANIHALHYKMVNSKLMQKTRFGNPQNYGNEVDGIASYHETQNKMYVFIYNNNSNPNSTSSENINVTIKNVKTAYGSTVTIKKWLVDDNHGNFWSEWYQIQQANNLTDNDFIWSRYALGPMSNKGWNVWNNSLSTLQPLSTISAVSTTNTSINNFTLSVNVNLDHHGVVLLEISNIKPRNKNEIAFVEYELETEKTHFENPVDNIIHLPCVTGFQIYNLQGQIILQNNQPCDVIDVSTLKQGLYILVSDGRRYKFIKK